VCVCGGGGAGEENSREKSSGGKNCGEDRPRNTEEVKGQDAFPLRGKLLHVRTDFWKRRRSAC